MTYNVNTIQPVFDKALEQVRTLRAAGYDAHIVGGALRVLALGGRTSDVDIAILISYDETWELRVDVEEALLGAKGYTLQHWSGYEDNKGFLCDWRSASDINIIAYDNKHYPNILDLVGKFDLNINQFLPCYPDDYTHLCNNFMSDGVVCVNPERDNDYQTDRLATRIDKFKAIYTDLDWSNVE